MTRRVVTLALAAIPLVATFMVAGRCAGRPRSGCYAGLGDTAWPTAFNLTGYWILGLPIAYAWGIERGGGVDGIWIPIGGALMWVAVLACARIIQLARRGERAALDEARAARGFSRRAGG